MEFSINCTSFRRRNAVQRWRRVLHEHVRTSAHEQRRDHVRARQAGLPHAAGKKLVIIVELNEIEIVISFLRLIDYTFPGNHCQ